MSSSSPRKLQKRLSTNFEPPPTTKKTKTENDLATCNSSECSSVSLQLAENISFDEYLSKSWVDIMDDEFREQHDVEQRQNELTTETTKPSTTLTTAEPVDFSHLPETLDTSRKRSASPFAVKRRRARRVATEPPENAWATRQSELLNNENTQDAGNVLDENSQLVDVIREDGDGTLQEIGNSEKKTEAEALAKDLSLTCKKLIVGNVKRYMPQYYKEPTRGWEWNETTIERRERDLLKGYNSDVYKRYVEQVSKSDRVRNVHPTTPNKHLKMSRRNWDMQVRLWRRALYVYMGDNIDSDASFISSSASEASSSAYQSELESVSDVSEDQAPSNTPDFPGEESTLTSNFDLGNRGPTNFSSLV